MLYLHLRREQLAEVLPHCAAAVRPGGVLLVLGHDRDNLERGVGGPPDREVLYDTELLGAAADGLVVERLEQVARPVGEHTALDTLLLARKS